MRIGAIDIGTNSMRLLVADYLEETIKNRKKYINTTRIGQGVDKEGIIQEDALERNLKALEEFYNLSKEEGCERIYCMGTSALRDAKNGKVFVDLAKTKIGLDVEIIDGKEESFLGFSGVLQGIEDKSDILVIDIGGGSTEFIVGDENGIQFSKSENVGALRMTEKFLKENPISKDEIIDMEKFIEKEISETIEYIKHKNIKKVVGIGGTITSVSAMNQELEVYSMDKIHNSIVNKSEIDNILQKLIKMTLDDKKLLKGLQPKRADIITAGVKILEIIMNKLEISQIIISEYDNLEGLICQKSKNMS